MRSNAPRPFPVTSGFGVLTFLILIAMAPARAQEGLAYLDPARFAANLKYTGLSYHPGGGENLDHYKRSLGGILSFRSAC